MAISVGSSTTCSHANGSSSTSQASFSWNSSGEAATKAVVVFVVTIAGTDNGSSVTYGGVSMTAVPYTGSDTDTEPGTVKAYFLDAPPTDIQSIVVSRTNNATAMIAFVIDFRAASATEVHLPGVITQGGSAQNTAATTSGTGTGASGEVAVTDGSPGTNSLRVACMYTGAASPVGAGTNSTPNSGLGGNQNDLGAFGASTVIETTPGQGSRNVGFATGTTDDRAAIYLAVREIPVSSSVPYVNPMRQFLAQ